jgi:hypothetical protein
VVTGVGKPQTQLICGSRRLHLLLHTTTFIGQLDDELCHDSSPAFVAGYPLYLPLIREKQR